MANGLGKPSGISGKPKSKSKSKSKKGSGNPTSNPGGPPPSSNNSSNNTSNPGMGTFGSTSSDTSTDFSSDYTPTGGTGGTYDSYEDYQAAQDPTIQMPGSRPSKPNTGGGGGPTTTPTPAAPPPPPPPPPSFLIPAEGETEDQEYERLQKLLTYMDEGGGNPGNNISDWPGTPEAREKLELRLRKIELNRELKASETRIAEGEEGLRGKVTESRLARESAATQALESKLEEASEFGMQARQLVGEQQASRGLLRSTVTGERLGDVNLREAQFKEGAKLRTSAFVDEGKRQEDIMFTERDQIRELAKQNRLYSELDQTIASIEDISRFERQMAHEREIAGAQMSSQQSAGFASFLGSVVSTVLSVAFFL